VAKGQPGWVGGICAAILTRTGPQSDYIKQRGSKQKLASVYLPLELAGLEVRNLLAGRAYDSSVIHSPDKATRQVIAAELLAVLFSQDFEEQARARQIFLDDGYFDEATRSLKTAESPADRATAARKLGMLGSQLATAHLIAAVFDTAPEVRRAAAEALIQIGDPGVATAPLNALLIGEMTRDIPEIPEPARRKEFMWLFLAVNFLAAGALAMASALAVQFLVLPFWLGGLVGLLLYLLTLSLNRLPDDDEESQMVMLDCRTRVPTNG
jgi:hypothetical protein